MARMRMKFRDQVENAGDDLAARSADAGGDRRERVEGVPTVGERQKAVACLDVDFSVRRRVAPDERGEERVGGI